MKKFIVIAVTGCAVIMAACWAPPIGWSMPVTAGPLWNPLGFLSSVVALAVYLLPTIIAVIRKKGNLLTIVLVNVLLGWTVVGWVVALVLALI